MTCDGKILTVEALMEILKTAPPKALVCVTSTQSDYQMARIEITSALASESDDTQLSEDLGEDLTPQSECGIRIPIVLFS